MSTTSRIHTLLVRRVSPTASNQHLTLTRLAQRSAVRPIATATVERPAPPKPSFLRRAFARTLRALVLTTLGFVMAAAPAYATVAGHEAPPSDEATTVAAQWPPAAPGDGDDDAAAAAAQAQAQAHEAHLAAHPLVRALRADAAFAEARPHLRIPPAWRARNLTAGALAGPDRVPFPPVAWLATGGGGGGGGGEEGAPPRPLPRLVQISFAGPALCGHPGIVHGGYLATLLDEGLARTAFAALPHGVGVTASLAVDYRAPCMAGQYLVLRAEVTTAEGRKAWVAGRVETLPEGDAEPVLLAEATALFIEPKNAALLSRNYSPQ